MKNFHNFEYYSSLKQNSNSLKIRLLLTDHCILLKSEISKIDEQELIQKSLKKVFYEKISRTLTSFQIPKILSSEMKEMQVEVMKRKEYEFVCLYYQNLFIDQIMNREEERRK